SHPPFDRPREASGGDEIQPEEPLEKSGQLCPATSSECEVAQQTQACPTEARRNASKGGRDLRRRIGDGVGFPRPGARQTDPRNQTLCALSAHREHEGVLQAELEDRRQNSGGGAI